MSDNEDDFQLIQPQQSTFQLIVASQYIKQQKKLKYQATLSESDKKNAGDINLLQNQYYHILITQNNKNCKQNIHRRFSDFDFLYEALFKTYPGIIFPAFPGKGILSYVKTKVSITKDTQYLKNRMKVLQRFINILLNDPRFKIQQCQLLKKFLSHQNQFEIFKKVQKSKNTWTIGSSLNNLWNYFSWNTKDHKYKNFQQEIDQIKRDYQLLQSKTKDMLNLLQQQIKQNQILKTKQFSFNQFPNYCQKLIKYQQKIIPFIQKLNELNFQLFCQNQDFIMVYNTLQNRQQLKKAQQTYQSIHKFQAVFGNQQKKFKIQKQNNKLVLRKKFQELLINIQNIGRF